MGLKVTGLSGENANKVAAKVERGLKRTKGFRPLLAGKGEPDLEIVVHYGEAVDPATLTTS